MLRPRPGRAPHRNDPTLDRARIDAAAAFAVGAHGDQVRTGTSIPYWTHPDAVAALVEDHGGTTEQVMAAWLHDVVEDCGGRPMLERVDDWFGPTVATLVEALSDSLARDGHGEPPWRERKEGYLERLARQVGGEAMLVSLADKTHNAESIVSDLLDPAVGGAVFDRFTASPSGVAWYYESLVAVFARDRSLPRALVKRFRRAVDVIVEHAADEALLIDLEADGDADPRAG